MASGAEKGRRLLCFFRRLIVQTGSILRGVTVRLGLIKEKH
jgi:hypothetical protein